MMIANAKPSEIRPKDLRWEALLGDSPRQRHFTYEGLEKKEKKLF
jgi:hypothetical protein